MSGQRSQETWQMAAGLILMPRERYGRTVIRAGKSEVAQIGESGTSQVQGVIGSCGC
jgi:hypothetical protein